ncbi:hypothetical protein [Aquitalea pelogenes]|uniref:hypothetical protein n=1 Tax=Aquitalea pelogenes TaxID=1293573 RepID=UPI0007874E20|nr:hypothetical protein [Aquitalea pelogenes]
MSKVIPLLPACATPPGLNNEQDPDVLALRNLLEQALLPIPAAPDWARCLHLLEEIHAAVQTLLTRQR